MKRSESFHRRPKSTRLKGAVHLLKRGSQRRCEVTNEMASYRIQREIDGHLLVFDSATSKRMGGIRQKGTSPELAVRRVLTQLGLRYRINNRDLPGSPDIANRSRKWAVFVHGCYWHRHPRCKKATTPKRNTAFWVAKFEANVARDQRAVRELRAMGYTVVTVWECEAIDSSALTHRLGRLGHPHPSRADAPSEQLRRIKQLDET